MSAAQALCTRIGFMVKPTEVSFLDLENLCQIIREKLFDLEVCIGWKDSIASESTSVTEISLSMEIIVAIGTMAWKCRKVRALVSATATSASSGAIGEQLSEQLICDGGIPLSILSEWWLTKGSS